MTMVIAFLVFATFFILVSASATAATATADATLSSAIEISSNVHDEHVAIELAIVPAATWSSSLSLSSLSSFLRRNQPVVSPGSENDRCDDEGNAVDMDSDVKTKDDNDNDDNNDNDDYNEYKHDQDEIVRALSVLRSVDGLRGLEGLCIVVRGGHGRGRGRELLGRRDKPRFIQRNEKGGGGRGDASSFFDEWTGGWINDNDDNDNNDDPEKDNDRDKNDDGIMYALRHLGPKSNILPRCKVGSGERKDEDEYDAFEKTTASAVANAVPTQTRNRNRNRTLRRRSSLAIGTLRMAQSDEAADMIDSKTTTMTTTTTTKTTTMAEATANDASPGVIAGDGSEENTGADADADAGGAFFQSPSSTGSDPYTNVGTNFGDGTIEKGDNNADTDSNADADEEDGPHPESFYVTNGLLALACVCIAALAAGLTLGVLSLDPLMLLIKMRAGSAASEREQASALLPIVRQHHMLLVTLLLMNSIANEALPLFLDKICGPVGAVIVSVTLVLFFGEIIPSAVFTGPNQLVIAAALVPLLKVIMALLCPVSWPIAKMLDCILHDDDDDDASAAHGVSVYNRGELSALVRIQYEERMAAKKRRKAEMRAFRKSEPMMNVAGAGGGGGGGYSVRFDSDRASINSLRPSSSLRGMDVNHVARTYRREMDHRLGAIEAERSIRSGSAFSDGGGNGGGNNDKRKGGDDENDKDDDDDNEDDADNGNGNGNKGGIRWSGRIPAAPESASERFASDTMSFASALHQDEVTMVEGALRMTETLALDAYKPMRNVFVIPHDMVLDEANIMAIFCRGYSRIPVYKRREGKKVDRDGGASADDDNEGEGGGGGEGGEIGGGNGDIPDEDDTKSICGVLIVKNLIVVDPRYKRGLSTLPLKQPLCVPPTINLVDLLNLMQTGGSGSKGGHMAVVCARPSEANRALDSGLPIPPDAGVMGIITLEDIIEELLQEEIYDENDRSELVEMRRAQWALARWKKYVKTKKVDRSREGGVLGSTNDDDGGGDDRPMVERMVSAAVRVALSVFAGPAAGRKEDEGAAAADDDDAGAIAEKASEDSRLLLDDKAEAGIGGSNKYGTQDVPELN